MEDNRDIIERIEAYCQRHGIAESTFGRLAVNDGKLVPRLRNGSSITMRTFRALDAFLKKDPEGADSAAAEVAP